MTNPDRQNYASAASLRMEDSQRSLFLQTLEGLSERLAVKPTDDFGKTLQATASRKFFEENNVKSNICKALFGSKSSRYLKITIKPSALIIEAFNDEKSTDKKASMILNVIGENPIRKSLFIADGKRNGQTVLAFKNMNIESSDCVALAKTVQAIVAQKELTK